MNDLSEKNVLIIIPKSQFCEKELYGVEIALKQRGLNVVVLSKSGQTAYGMNQETIEPDGMIIDWNKQKKVQGKYHAVILVGGKGAKKSLWNDTIIPQILTDHFRSGSVIGAIGSAIVVLVRASLVNGEVPEQLDEETRKELELLNTSFSKNSVTSLGNIVCGQGEGSVDKFLKIILDLMEIGDVPSIG